MANDHPFQVLFETLGRVPIAHSVSVNRQAYEILSGILTLPLEKSGRCILLRAPRAGHGKTHLLSRIQHQLGASHEFIPLQAAFGCRIDAVSVTDDALRRLVRQLPASGGLTVLDLITRRLFASALQPLVASGEVPCQDREGALTALRNRPMETFDFHHPNAVTAHWAMENFEVLGQRLSLELAQRCDLPVGGVSFWVDALFHFASAPLEASNRIRVLAESVHTGAGTEMERLEALLGLVSLLVRVVLVADDLEGFSSDETAALRLAAFLGSLRQSVERLDVILSLNQDIWESAFLPRLSGGLADRLSEVVVELEPLTEQEMEALLDSRVPGLGRRVLDRIDRDAAGTHARGLIRAAGVAWLKATAMDSALPPAAPVPAVSVVPVVPVVVPAPAAFVVETPPPAVSGMVVPEPQFEPEPVVESTAFTFATAPSLEAPVEWPAPVFSPPPTVETLETVPEPQAYHTPVESPFEVFTPESPVEWQEPSQDIPAPAPMNPWNPPAPVLETPQLLPPVFEAPVGVPFQVNSPWMSSEPAAEWPVFAPTDSSAPQPSLVVPVDEFVPMESSVQPLQPPLAPEPPAPAFQPDPEPAFNPPPVTVTPPPSAGDTDRVDDLLRQFRERYGRGSL